MAFLTRKERLLAKHNKKMGKAQEAYNGLGHCYTCKYKKRVEGFYGYSYKCKLNYDGPDDEDDRCEYHIYDKSSQKLIRYVEKIINNNI